MRLTCTDGRMLTDAGKGKYTIYLKCSDQLQPKIVRTENAGCSTVGSDGTTDNLDRLTKVQIGWEVGNFKLNA